jgi:hypothetical protein
MRSARAKAIALMLGNPSTIERPILEIGKAFEIGFKPERCAAPFVRRRVSEGHRSNVRCRSRAALHEMTSDSSCP